MLFHSGLEELQLFKIIHPDLQVGLPTVNELQAFSQGPLILFDEVGDYNGTGPGFAIDGVDKTALALLNGLFDEVVEGIEGIIFFIKNL